MYVKNAKVNFLTCINVFEKILPRIKPTLASRASFPPTIKQTPWTRCSVQPCNVPRKLFQGCEPSATVVPSVKRKKEKYYNFALLKRTIFF